MSYADYEYYRDIFGGNMDEKEANKFLKEASFEIDNICYGRIKHTGFNNLTEYQQELVKQAVCYRAEFISKYAEYLNMPITGFSAGDISMSFKSENETDIGIYADKRTIEYLARTGLSSRRL